MNKLEGVVKFFKKQSAWGFITSDGKDYFVHSNNVLDKEKNLYYGESVVFNLVETTKGKMAVDVERKRPDIGVCDSEPTKTEITH